MAYRVKAYTLREESTESGTRYFISFKDGQGKSHELEVSEQFFMEFRRMERRNRNPYLQNGGQQCPLKIVRCAALNMSRALVHQGIVLLVPRRYGGRNQTRANAGAENRKG